MPNTFTFVAVSLLGIAAPSTALLPFQNYKMQGPPPPVIGEGLLPSTKPFAIIKEFNSGKTATKEVAEPKPKEKRLICKGCSQYESLALDFFQDQGIKDRNALATILGNIKQESMFVPNICEGGSRTSYYSCRWGGYGLIQWTSANRYHGLGDFARKFGGDPSSIHTQLRYLTNEIQWKEIEPLLKTPGKPISRYMNYAYSWLGWGIHGARTHYAHEYANKLITVEV